MGEVKFGASFPEGLGEINRLDVLKKSSRQETENSIQELPDYVLLAREVRKKMRDTLKTEGWPEEPRQLSRVEDLFAQAEKAVAERWTKVVSPFFAKKCKSWLDKLNSISNLEIKQKLAETPAIASLLANPDQLEGKIAIKQFGILEPLRGINPGIWRSLLLVCAERQMATAAVVRNWLEQMPDEELQKTGLNKIELKLFLDINAYLQKSIDHAYVKQSELADLPGGSEKTEMAKIIDDKIERATDPDEKARLIMERRGLEYVYDLTHIDEGEEKINLKTYREMFKFEYGLIYKHLNRMIELVQIYRKTDNLPPIYDRFAVYLRHVADAYGQVSKDGDLDLAAVRKQWEDLKKEMLTLSMDGCPIVIIPQACPAVGGDSEKTDAEFRFGIQTERTKWLQKLGVEFGSIVDNLNQEQGDRLADKSKTPAVLTTYQAFAGGSNLYWHTRGEADSTSILAHVNAVEQVAEAKEFPLLRKIFGEGAVDSTRYSTSANIENLLHEFGHQIVRKEDPSVAANIKDASQSDKSAIEEMKAETGGMKVLGMAVKEEKIPTDFDLRMQFMAKLGNNLDYLANKSPVGSGERYYLCGVLVFDTLLREKVILLNEESNLYEVVDPAKGVGVLAEIADKIGKIYTGESEDSVGGFVDGLRKMAEGGQNPALDELIKRVKNT